MASGNLGDLIVRVGADLTGFAAGMSTVSGKLSAVDREANKAGAGFDRIGRSLTGIGTGLTAAVTLPIVGAAAASVSFATTFDLAMRQVTSLLGGATQEKFDALSSGVLSLAKSMGIDAVDAANALYEAISAGIPEENALDFIQVASVAAIAGITDTRVAVDALTTLIAAYGLATSDAKELSDAMFQAVNVGKFQFADLAGAIGPAAQQASNLGISYTELLAATATLSISSGGVSVAVTQIESAMRSLLNPTSEMKTALNAIGYESGSAAIKALGFEGTLQALRTTTGDNAEAFNALFGRIEGANGALGLTGPKAAAAAADLDTLKNASDGIGASMAAYNEINKSTSREFDTLKNNLKSTAIELGTALLPSINSLLIAAGPLVEKIASLVSAFTSLPESTQNSVFGIAAAIAAIGPLVLIAGQASIAIGGITKAASLLGAALGNAGGLSGVATTAVGALAPLALAATAVYAAVTVIGDVKSVWKDTFADVPEVEDWTESLNEKLGDVLDSLGGLKQPLIDLGTKIQDTFSGDWYKNLIPGVFALNQFKQALSDTATALIGIGQAVGLFSGESKAMEEAIPAHIDKMRELAIETNGADISLGALVAQQKASKDSLTALNPKVIDAKAALEAQKQAAEDAKKQIADYGINLDTARGQQVDHTLEVYKAKTAASALKDTFGLELNPALLAVTPLLDAAKAATTDYKMEMWLLDDAMSQLAIDAPPLGAGLQAIVDDSANETQLGKLASLQTAMANIGITTTASLQQAAIDAQAVFDGIVAAGGDLPGGASYELVQANVRRLAAMKALDLARGIDWGIEQDAELQAAKDTLAAMEGATVTHKENIKPIWAEIGGIMTGAISGVNDAFVDAVIFGGDFGTAIKNVFLNAAADVADFVLESIENKLWKALKDSILEDGPIQALGGAFKSVFEKIGGWIGDAVGALTGLGSKAVSVAGSILGVGGGTAGAVSDIAGGISNAPIGEIGGAVGEVAGTAGGVGGAVGQVAGATVSSVLGVVTGAVSAVTGVISAFQNARQETTLNAIEYNTRYVEIYFKQPGGVLDYLNRIWDAASGMRAYFPSWDDKLFSLYEMRDVVKFDLTPAVLALRDAALDKPAPSITVPVTINGNVYGIDDLKEQISAAIMSGITLQGVPV